MTAYQHGDGPLAGIRVLDLTAHLSGPYGTMILADLGADVLKVERLGAGDSSRALGPHRGDLSAYFASVNRGKRSLRVDFKQPAGRELVLRLAERCDVLVENFAPGTTARLGLDYPPVAVRNPRLVYASCTGFGHSGPLAHRPAFDIVVQAMAGTMAITGQPDGPPTRAGFSIGDIGAGLQLALGILAALVERERSGRGQWLDLSMLDAQVALLENAFSRYFLSGEVPGRIGSRHPLATPFQAFPTADGYVVLTAHTDALFGRFCALVGRPDLPPDPRFNSRAARNANHAALEPLLEAATRRKTTAEWLALLEAAAIPCGPVNGIDQAAALEQLAVREMFVDLDDPTGSVRYVNSPLRYSRSAVGPRTTAPRPGQHTDAILAALLDLDSPAIAELRRQGVVE